MGESVRAQPTKPAKKVYEVVADALVTAGVKCIFGLMGEDNAPLLVAAVARGIKYYAARHENQAVAMADGYFRSTGLVGVAVVTGGPGFTNALTAINTAHRAGSSVLVLSGAARQLEDEHDPSNIRNTTAVSWLKYFRTYNLMMEAGINCVRPLKAADAVAETFRAFIEVQHRTTVLMLGRVILLEDMPGDWTPTEMPKGSLPRAPSAESIAELADLLQESWVVSRPMILAGRGALKSDAKAALIRLGELTGALLATTLPVKGLFHGEEFSIGVCGTYSTPPASELISQVDCVLAFGASLNKFTTYYGSFFRKAHIVQVEAEESGLAKYLEPALSVHADARLTAEALVAELERRKHRAPGFRTAENQKALDAYSKSEGIVDKSTSTLIDPNRLSLELDRMLPPDRIVCCDAGQHSRFPNALMGVNAVRNWSQPLDAGAIGLGLGCAIGTQIGRPGSLVVSFVGDGGLAMSLGDLETVVRLNLPLLVVIGNDAAFGAEVNVLSDLGMSTDLAKIPSPSFARIAEAMGAQAATVRTVADLGVVEAWLASGRKTPLILDCQVNPAVRGM